jgi:hypothetical protein
MKLGTELPKLVEIVSDRISTVVIAAINALIEDGKPFGWSEMTEEEKMEEYQLLRDSSDAMYRYMDLKVQGFIQKLKEAGLQDEQIAEIQPYTIVIVRILNEWYQMEKKLGKGGEELEEEFDAVPA